MKVLNGDIRLEAQTLEPEDFVGDRVGNGRSRVTTNVRHEAGIASRNSGSTGADTKLPSGRQRRINIITIINTLPRSRSRARNGASRATVAWGTRVG
jgi:hypothetical protein